MKKSTSKPNPKVVAVMLVQLASSLTISIVLPREQRVARFLTGMGGALVSAGISEWAYRDEEAREKDRINQVQHIIDRAALNSVIGHA